MPEPIDLGKIAEMLTNPPEGKPAVREISSSADQVAELQGKVEDLDNRLKEERFLWILVGTIVFDAVFMLQAGNWAAPIVIGILQLIGLVVLAQKCRVDPIMPLIDRLGGFLGQKSK